MDEIDILNKKLREVVEKFDDLKKSGMDEDILITWLVVKTKLSRKKVEEILTKTQEFYDKLIKRNVIKNLK